MKKYSLFVLFLFLIYNNIYSIDWKQTISKYGSAICLIEVIDDIGSKVSGSGFVISKDGLILTNAHVVKMAYFSKDYRVEVKFLNSSDSDKVYTANVIEIDINKDIAIIKIDKNFDNYCLLGDSSKLENMDEILVIGYPLGMGFKSTPGYIQSFQDINEYGKMLDLSAIVDPGNSGGPVFNKNSEVIGIVTAKFFGYNFNLAIPINSVKDFINSSTKSRKIKIVSQPSGADVYIGGNLIGKTPVTYNIFGSKAYIKISKDGYFDVEKEIDQSIKNGETLQFNLEKKFTKILKIKSNPANANIYIDNKLQGKTPIEIKVEGKKSVKITLKKDWYKDYEQEVVLDSSETRDINLNMALELNYEVNIEHGNFGFTLYLPTSFIYWKFFEMLGVGKGFSYMINYPTNEIIRFYFSTDFIFAGSNKNINPYMPSLIDSAFFYLNDYAWGVTFRLALNRFHLFGGLALKIAYYVLNASPLQNTIGGFAPFGGEINLGFQIYANTYFGFYFYYKIGIAPDIIHAILKREFLNIDGHYLSFGVRF